MWGVFHSLRKVPVRRLPHTSWAGAEGRYVPLYCAASHGTLTSEIQMNVSLERTATVKSVTGFSHWLFPHSLESSTDFVRICVGGVIVSPAGKGVVNGGTLQHNLKRS